MVSLSLLCACVLAHTHRDMQILKFILLISCGRCCPHTQILKCILLIPVADAVLEYFFDAAMKEFIVGRVEQTQWHPDYCSPRVAMYVLVKK